jgi:hypothetical protein
MLSAQLLILWVVGTHPDHVRTPCPVYVSGLSRSGNDQLDTACVDQGNGNGCSTWPRWSSSPWSFEDSDDGDQLIMTVRPHRRVPRRCGGAAARPGGMTRADLGGAGGTWTSRPCGCTWRRVYLEAAVPRVNCPEHGPTTIEVSWPRHASRFTTGLEHTAAWLSAQAPASAVAELLRTTWRRPLGQECSSTRQRVANRAVRRRAGGGGSGSVAGRASAGAPEIAHQQAVGPLWSFVRRRLLRRRGNRIGPGARARCC